MPAAKAPQKRSLVQPYWPMRRAMATSASTPYSGINSTAASTTRRNQAGYGRGPRPSWNTALMKITNSATRLNSTLAAERVFHSGAKPVKGRLAANIKAMNANRGSQALERGDQQLAGDLHRALLGPRDQYPEAGDGAGRQVNKGAFAEQGTKEGNVHQREQRRPQLQDGPADAGESKGQQHR